MSVLLAILSIVVFACLVLAAGMYPIKSSLSSSELKRRAKNSAGGALELSRYEAHATLVTLLRTARAILLVLLVCSLIGGFGWGGGVVLALILAVIYPSVARVGFVRNAGRSLYQKIEVWLLEFVHRFQRVLHAIREPSNGAAEPLRKIYSREDLAELIAHSEEVVGRSEQALLSSALSFFGRTVKEVMTPRSVIDFIKQAEFLGPLVLDELHSLGHSRLPVIAEDLDHVVGVLHLRDLLSLDIKRSTTAEKAMETKVYYIREDDTLEHALAAFLRARHHLFIVINQNRETVGLLTLEDTIEALIGRQIMDEDDIHTDLRKVAEQEGRLNNTPAEHVDL